MPRPRDARPEPRPWPTVLIPTWQEAPLVADAVQCAARLADEVIVADGESPDRTAEIAPGGGRAGGDLREGARAAEVSRGFGRCDRAATRAMAAGERSPIVERTAQSAVPQALERQHHLSGHSLA